MRCSILVTFLCIVSTNLVLSQDKWANWSSVQLNYVANKKVTLKFKPIIRLKENLTEYNNTSLDAIIKYKFNKNWSASILHRHFFVPNKLDIEFLFFDVKHSGNLGSRLQLSNQLRYHLNYNLTANRVDFFRYLTSLKFISNKKIDPFVSIELWLRTNEPTSFAGARYMLGAIYKLKSNLAIDIHYRRQSGYSDFPINSENVVMLNLIFALKPTLPN